MVIRLKPQLLQLELVYSVLPLLQLIQPLLKTMEVCLVILLQTLVNPLKEVVSLEISQQLPPLLVEDSLELLQLILHNQLKVACSVPLSLQLPLVEAYLGSQLTQLLLLQVEASSVIQLRLNPHLLVVFSDNPHQPLLPLEGSLAHLLDKLLLLFKQFKQPPRFLTSSTVHQIPTVSTIVVQLQERSTPT